MADQLLYGKEEDLTYNRQGRLSPRQAELTSRPLKLAAVAVALGGVITLMLIIGLPLLMQEDGETVTMFAVIGGIMVLVDLGATAFLWRKAQNAHTQQLEIIEGPLEAVSHTPGGGLGKRMKIAGRTVSVPKPNLAMQIGKRYRVYGLDQKGRGYVLTYVLEALEDGQW